jgi:hypothetical protein
MIFAWMPSSILWHKAKLRVTALEEQYSLARKTSQENPEEEQLITPSPLFRYKFNQT